MGQILCLDAGTPTNDIAASNQEVWSNSVFGRYESIAKLCFRQKC